MNKIFLCIFAVSLLLGHLQADKNTARVEENTTAITATETNKTLRKEEDQMGAIMKKLAAFETKTDEGNIWTKIYSNYRTYRELKARQEKLITEIFRLKRLKHRTQMEEKQLEAYQVERQTNEGKIQLLEEFQEDPFKKLLEPPKIEEIPKIGNPFSILSAVSYLKKLKSDQDTYENNFRTLEMTLERLNEEKRLLKVMLHFRPKAVNLQQHYEKTLKEIETLMPTFEIFKTTKEVYNKKIEEIRLKVNESIKREAEKAVTIVGIILLMVVRE